MQQVIQDEADQVPSARFLTHHEGYRQSPADCTRLSRRLIKLDGYVMHSGQMMLCMELLGLSCLHIACNFGAITNSYE